MDLSKLGRELRDELGKPPLGWTERQRLRLRGADLTPRSRWPRARTIGAASGLIAVACSILLWLHLDAPSVPPTASVASDLRSQQVNEEPNVDASEREGPDAKQPDALKTSRKLGGPVGPWTHTIEGGGTVQLENGSRGVLEEDVADGSHFKLQEGTAHFQVKKRDSRPFSVVAGDYKVFVLGTRFTVAYRPPDAVDVQVREGTVEVHLPARSDGLLVKEGESLVATSGGFALKKLEEPRAKTGDAPVATAPPAPEKGSDFRALYQRGKYREACEAVGSEADQLRSTLGVAALLDLAGAFRLCGKTGQAMLTLERLRARFPGSSESHDALFFMGRIQASSGATASAITQLEQYLSGGPNGRFTAEALGRLIELHIAQGQSDRARRYASRYLTVAPRGAYRRLAESLVSPR